MHFSLNRLASVRKKRYLCGAFGKCGISRGVRCYLNRSSDSRSRFFIRSSTSLLQRLLWCILFDGYRVCDFFVWHILRYLRTH